MGIWSDFSAHDSSGYWISNVFDESDYMRLGDIKRTFPISYKELNLTKRILNFVLIGSLFISYLSIINPLDLPKEEEFSPRRVVNQVEMVSNLTKTFFSNPNSR